LQLELVNLAIFVNLVMKI